jgi:hypothetical protein
MQIPINPHIVIYDSYIQVFACLTDIDKWSQWGGNLISTEQISAESLQIGSQIRQVTKSGRKPSESILEVTHYVPGQFFGIKGQNLEGLFTLEPLESGTILHAQFQIEATGLMAVMYKLMLTRFVMNDLQRFKKMVESKQG